MLVTICKPWIDRNGDAHVGAASSTFDNRKNTRRDAVWIPLTALSQQEQLIDDDVDARDTVVTGIDDGSEICSANVRCHDACTDDQCHPEPRSHRKSSHDIAFKRTANSGSMLIPG